MEKKNKLLIGLVLAFLAANLIFLLVPKKGSSISYNENMFALADTAAISEIQFSKEGAGITLKKSDDKWELNGAFPIDDGLRRLLFSIMQRVRVRRPVEEQIGGTTVTFDGERLLSFMVSSNATKTKTYFTVDGKSYEVEIPGYRDYLANIFELNADQWRDRMIFNGSWRTIQKLTMDYKESEESDFTIRFKDKFFEVEGVSPIDSSLVVDYLNRFQYWKANERISNGRFPRYDSLSQTEPTAVLTVESINYSDPESFFIYKALDDERFVLIKNKTNEMVIFDQRRVNEILLKQADFKLVE